MKPTTEIVGPVESMGADLVPLRSLTSPVVLPLPEQVREYIRASKAENTLRGYSSDWGDFCAWSEAHGLSPLPASPESVAAYIAECAGRLKVVNDRGDICGLWVDPKTGSWTPFVAFKQ